MILTDEEIGALWVLAPEDPDGNEFAGFARLVEREVLRKLREAGPVGYRVIDLDDPAQGFWFNDTDLTDRGYGCTPLFTIPEEQT